MNQRLLRANSRDSKYETTFEPSPLLHVFLHRPPPHPLCATPHPTYRI